MADREAPMTHDIHPAQNEVGARLGAIRVQARERAEAKAVGKVAKRAARVASTKIPVAGQIPGVGREIGKVAGKIAEKEASFFLRHKALVIATLVVFLVPLVGPLFAFPMLLLLSVMAFFEGGDEE